VLIAAATGRDPDRTFVSSTFLCLEVLPKASYYRRRNEVEFYEAFFASVVAWAEPLDRLVRTAEQEAAKAGLALADALHVAAAVMLDADEFVTTERMGRAIYRVTGLRIRSIHPAATQAD